MKANPKAYFPNPFLCVIGYRKVDKYAEYQKQFKPYFPTWEEAHAYLVSKNAAALQSALADAVRHQKKAAKIAAMQRPAATDFTLAVGKGKSK